MTKATSILSTVYLVVAGAAFLALAGDAQVRPAGSATWLAAEAAGFSGVALIGRGDAIEAEVASGLADTATNRPITRNTRFNLGSINKTFTAIAIAQLMEQGRLGLDDRLVKHLPDYPDRSTAQRITIRHLLTHRSGVAQFMRADFGDVSAATMAALVAKEPMAFEPGTRQMYSNGGYVILGRVVEVISGVSYDDYIREHIYRPAGMTSSGSVREQGQVTELALGNGQAPPRPGNPAGGGYSTATDLFRFARALRTGRLLGPKMTRYVTDGTFAEEPKWGFALREQTAGHRRFIGNGGGAPGVNAEFRFEPAGASTVVVLANASPPAATNLLTAILNRVADVSAGSSTAATPQTKIPPNELRRELEALHTEMMTAFQRDPVSVARFYTDDARILGGARRYTGAAQPRTHSQD
jgi:CubicO group peptidase (beta-lactamase class C family)